MAIPQVLQLNESGIPVGWIPWQRVAFFKAKNRVVWEMGDHDWTKYGGISRMTGNRTSVNVSSIVAIRGNHMPKRNVPPLTNLNLFGRDLNICAYCGHEKSHKQLTKDHILPTSRGGLNTWTNCVTACGGCNNYKGDRTPEELGMQLLYVPYTPSREEAILLRGRNVLVDQMEFLQKFLPDHSRLKH